MIKKTRTFIIHVNQDKKQSVFDALSKKYGNSTINFRPDVNETARIFLQITTKKSESDLVDEIKVVDGVTHISSIPSLKIRPKIFGSYIFYVMIGFFSTVGFFLILLLQTSGLIQVYNSLNQLTNFHTLIIDFMIGGFITFWLWRHEQTWQKDVSEVLTEVRILSTEIKEYVERIDDTIDKKLKTD